MSLTTTSYQYADTDTYPVFAVVYVEGSALPVFKGVHPINLKTERQLRSVLLQTYPTVRKVKMTVLGQNGNKDPIALPDFFLKSKGEFRFSMMEKLAANRKISPVSVAAPQVSRKKEKTAQMTAKKPKARKRR